MKSTSKYPTEAMSKLVSVYSSKSTSTAFAFFSLSSESTFWIMAVSMLRTFICRRAS